MKEILLALALSLSFFLPSLYAKSPHAASPEKPKGPQGASVSGVAKEVASAVLDELEGPKVPPPQAAGLPPGLAKQETLPPGLAKKEALPPGLQRPLAPAKPVKKESLTKRTVRDLFGLGRKAKEKPPSE